MCPCVLSCPVRVLRVCRARATVCAGDRRPCYAMFSNVDPDGFPDSSYSIHVFVVAKVDSEAWAAPGDVYAFDEAPGYAGATSIFGGRGTSCDNCAIRDPFTIAVDVADALKSIGLTQNDIALKVVVTDDDDEVVASPVDIGIPAPELRGPTFSEDDLSKPPAGTEAPSTLWNSHLQSKLAS